MFALSLLCSVLINLVLLHWSRSHFTPLVILHVHRFTFLLNSIYVHSSILMSISHSIYNKILFLVNQLLCPHVYLFPNIYNVHNFVFLSIVVTLFNILFSCQLYSHSVAVLFCCQLIIAFTFLWCREKFEDTKVVIRRP